MSGFLSSGFTTGADATTPSWIEMVATTQMMDTLRPAAEYIIQVAGLRFKPLRPLLSWSEEVYTVSLFFLERHFLQYYGGTFAESFYGLSRVPLPSGQNSPLRSGVAPSLALTVLLPYLKRKLGHFVREHDAETLPTPFLRAARQILPWLNLAFETLVFLYSLAFLFEKTRHFSPLLHLQGIRHSRLSAAQLEKQTALRELKRELLLRRLPAVFRFAVRLSHLFFDYLKYILPLSIFFIKFLEWWYQETAETAAKALPTPPPPPAPSGSLDVPFLDDSSLCQICTLPRTNPAIAGGCGYAFCFPCLYRWIDQRGTCPVTRLPLTINNIQKIFERS